MGFNFSKQQDISLNNKIKKEKKSTLWDKYNTENFSSAMPMQLFNINNKDMDKLMTYLSSEKQNNTESSNLSELFNDLSKKIINKSNNKKINLENTDTSSFLASELYNMIVKNNKTQTGGATNDNTESSSSSSSSASSSSNSSEKEEVSKKVSETSEKQHTLEKKQESSKKKKRFI